MGTNLWFTRFENAGDSYVIQSGVTYDWVTVAR